MARILGIDIDTGVVRAAVLRTAFRGIEIERYLQIPLSQAPESPGRLPDLQDALTSIARTLGSGPVVCVSALDGSDASLRVVTVPAGAAKRVAEVLPFELESVLPFEIADAVIDQQPIGVRDGQHALLAAAVRTQKVREHLAQFQGSPLDPREVAVGAAALDGLCAVCPALREGVVALIELREGEANVCVLSAGRAVFARSLSVGEVDLPRHGQALAEGLHRTFAAYRAGGGDAPAAIFFAGSAQLADFAAGVAQDLAAPIDWVALPGPAGASTPAHPAFARALALAARATQSGKRLNLRTGALAPTGGRGALAGLRSLAAACAAAVLVSLLISLKAEQSMLADEHEALKARLSETTTSVFGKAETDPEAVAELLRSPPSENPLPRFDAYDALAAISAAVPADLKHEVKHMRIDLADEKREGKLELQGELASLDQRDRLIAGLEAHGCFKDVSRGRTSPARSADQISYQIEAKVQCPGDAPAGKKKKPRSTDDE